MTLDEARPLIDAVAEGGGPIRFNGRWEREYIEIGPFIAADDGSPWTGFPSTHLDWDPCAADMLAGALKRDLIERGLEVTTRSFGGTERFDPYYTARLRRGSVIIADAEGDSELHALLEAWTDAAQLEGWGS